MDPNLQLNIQRAALLGLANQFFRLFVSSQYWADIKARFTPIPTMTQSHTTAGLLASWELTVHRWMASPDCYITQLSWGVDFKDPQLGRVHMLGSMGDDWGCVDSFSWRRGHYDPSGYLELSSHDTLTPPLDEELFAQVWSAFRTACQRYARRNHLPLPEKGRLLR